MRLTSIEAENFTSFVDLDLPVDSDLTILVGPNRAGKSNVVRCLDVVRQVLQWRCAGHQDAYQEVAAYERASHRARPEGGFVVRLGVTLDQEWEQELLVTYLRSVVLASIRSDGPDLHHVVTEGELPESVTPESLAPLMIGRLVVTSTPEIDRNDWQIGWEFAHDGATFTLILESSASRGVIVRGPLTTQRQRASETVSLADRVMNQSGGLDFEFSDILPADGKAVMLDMSTIGRRRWTAPDLRRFLELAGLTPDAGSTYPVGLVFAAIVERGLVLTSDLRRPPRLAYETDDLGRQARLTDGEETLLHLARLKNGTATERSRFAAVQSLFAKLTLEDLEVRVDIVGRDGGSGSDSPRVWIEADTTVGGEWISVAMAGAGSWEALVCSTLAVGTEASVIALDEPAVNLHPPVQRQLVGELARLPAQVLVVTHSAEMATPGALRRGQIVRLTNTYGGTECHAPRELPAPHARLLDDADFREALFAHGVVLVEGSSEVGALTTWLESAADGGPNARSVLFYDVGGEQGFAAACATLDAYSIPWVILADGPALDPGNPKEPLRSVISDRQPAAPRSDAGFEVWRSWWELHGVFTFADQFGTGTRDGEFEQFLKSVDPEGWEESTALFDRSKPRAARHFATMTPCPPEVERWWGWVRSTFPDLRLRVPPD